MLLYFIMLLAFNSENSYQHAETEANLVLSLPHEEKDSSDICNGKMRFILLRDSVLNKPGCIGTEYNYPIYKFETEIVYYKDQQIASVEKREIHLKRYERFGVTTGIRITAVLDSLHSYYFDPEENLITHTQLVELQAKICKGN
jgi:hypothetical protein